MVRTTLLITAGGWFRFFEFLFFQNQRITGSGSLKRFKKEPEVFTKEPVTKHWFLDFLFFS
jgi:hypothetical protein